MPESAPERERRAHREHRPFRPRLARGGRAGRAGSVLDAVAAVEAAGFGERADSSRRCTPFSSRSTRQPHLRSGVRDFLERKGGLVKLIAMMSPQAPSQRSRRGRRRRQPRRRRSVQCRRRRPKADPSLELDARFTVSDAGDAADEGFRPDERGRDRGGAQADRALVMPDDEMTTRRFAASAARPHRPPAQLPPFAAAGRRDRPRLAARRAAPPPIVALCDISGSMSEYTRLFLHFLHALGETRRVSTFLFGTRLTNVTRAMRARDPDEALAQVRQARGRLVGRNADRRGARAVQPRMVAARCSARARSSCFSPTGSNGKASSDLGGRDGTAAQVEPAAHLGQSAVAFRRLRGQGARRARDAAACRRVPADPQSRQHGRSLPGAVRRPDSAKDPKAWLRASAA